MKPIDELRRMTTQNVKRIKEEKKQKRIDYLESLSTKAKNIWENTRDKENHKCSLQEYCEERIQEAVQNGKFSVEVKAFEEINSDNYFLRNLTDVLDGETFRKKRRDLGECVVNMAKQELTARRFHVKYKRAPRLVPMPWPHRDRYTLVSWFLYISWE